MAGTPDAAAGVAADLVMVSQKLQVFQDMLEASCEDTKSQTEVLKLITARMESKTALLQKEARLAGTAAGELWGSSRAAEIALRDVWQHKSHARLASNSAAPGDGHGLVGCRDTCSACCATARNVREVLFRSLPAKLALPTSNLCWCSGSSVGLACSVSGHHKEVSGCAGPPCQVFKVQLKGWLHGIVDAV